MPQAAAPARAARPKAAKPRPRKGTPGPPDNRADLVAAATRIVELYAARSAWPKPALAQSLLAVKQAAEDHRRAIVHLAAAARETRGGLDAPTVERMRDRLDAIAGRAAEARAALDAAVAGNSSRAAAAAAERGVTVEAVTAQLVAAQDQLGPIAYDPTRQILSLTTGPVVLTGRVDAHDERSLQVTVALGRFRIDLAIQQFGYRDPASDGVRATALEPVEPRNRYSHPHVNVSGDVCLGTALRPFLAAIAQARVYDALLVVHTVLTVYGDNPSPYICLGDLARPARRDAAPPSPLRPLQCGRCGRTTCRDRLQGCRGCGLFVCPDCLVPGTADACAHCGPQPPPAETAPAPDAQEAAPDAVDAHGPPPQPPRPRRRRQPA